MAQSAALHAGQQLISGGCWRLLPQLRDRQARPRPQLQRVRPLRAHDAKEEGAQGAARLRRKRKGSRVGAREEEEGASPTGGERPPFLQRWRERDEMRRNEEDGTFVALGGDEREKEIR
ncbi:unnamed protein product [Miscanthus lutarioriparius]|uniref:Uncharacterized protein n=1 Tax=Miscanthus lutarioriparius TaxID=422564 RepID=A0A811NLV9_9POAL|nr:unnamed protein product [Miscanthus lutarioriparius]